MALVAASSSAMLTSSLSMRRCAVRCQAEPVRRPSAPSTPVVATPPSPSSSPAVEAPKAASAGGVTLEFQRQSAKEMVAYFEARKLEEEVKEGQLLGWTRKNEIGNGRWAMFGLAVGLLTEFATGVDFPEQLSIIFGNLGIID